MLNPVYCTEPVLCGVVRLGNEQALADIRESVRSAEPTPAVVRHNLKRCVSKYQKTITQYRQEQISFGLRSLNFAVSYQPFARWYADGRQPATIDDIRAELDTHSVVDDVFAVHSRSKAGEAVDLDQLENLLMRWEQECLL